MVKIISKRGKPQSEPLPQEETNAILSEQMLQEDVDILFDLAAGDDEDAYDGWYSSGLTRQGLIWNFEKPVTPELGDAVMCARSQVVEVWVGTRWVRMTLLGFSGL